MLTMLQTDKHNFAPGSGIGKRVPRKEDDRFLRGKGVYVGDIFLPNMLDIAFVRSPLAHARITSISKPAGFESRVFTADDLPSLAPITAITTLAGFRASSQPILAAGKVRHVGEPIAACLADSRAEAEDIAELVEVSFEELPALADMLTARTSSTLVHEHWEQNVFLETRVDGIMPATAPIIVQRRLRTARQCMSPIEGRGVVAQWDTRLEQLIITSSTQMPHIIRSGLAECLGLPEEQIRIIAPDVGGGFGYKGILLQEEVIAAHLARLLGRPVRWLEDRREQLTANADCREHHYDLTAYADGEGKLLALDCTAHVDAGAYSIYPFSACLEGAQVASILPGPYMMEAYRCLAYSVATNKPSILPYRGVARAGVCYAMESIMDGIAHAAGLEPIDVRLKNLVPPEAMPFDNITGKHFDSGDYPAALRRAAAALDIAKYRAIQAAETGTVRTGIGIAIYCEQGAHGTSVYAGWGVPMVPGYEQATARLTPDGGVEIRVGIHSHGQGLETTLAQVAHEILGVSIDRIKVVHGDTGLTPYSTGTWGSRCMVMAGGAVATASKELLARAKHIAAHLLQTTPEALQRDGDQLMGPAGQRISLGDVARTWYRRPQDLPGRVDGGGLDVTAGYKTKRDSGTFSYAAHACALSVDTETGAVKIIEYVVCEDGGTLINPQIVDGQIIGGLAQGIGTALYEEMIFDDGAQPLCATLADYMLPGATEVPVLRIEHMETKSPYTEFGQKGIGEGGAIGPPAAIANAVNDALRPFQAFVAALPLTPHRILEALAK